MTNSPHRDRISRQPGLVDEGFRRIFSRFEKLDVLFLGFLNFALIIDALR
jgi:hypothetical protein